MSKWVFIKYFPLWLSGIAITSEIAFTGFGIALVAALALALLRRSRFRPVRYMGSFITQLSRNTPILVSLVWLYYALPQIIGINYGSMTAAIAAIALQATGYQAEVYRAGIESIDLGQFRAGRALGMTEALLMRRVILPQAVLRIVPPTVNVFSTSLKSTSIVSIIAVPDIMLHASRLTSYLFEPVQIYSTAAVIYIFLVGITAYIADALDWYVKRGQVMND